MTTSITETCNKSILCLSDLVPLHCPFSACRVFGRFLQVVATPVSTQENIYSPGYLQEDDLEDSFVSIEIAAEVTTALAYSAIAGFARSVIVTVVPASGSCPSLDSVLV
jgi:hypothetical protein